MSRRIHLTNDPHRPRRGRRLDSVTPRLESCTEPEGLPVWRLTGANGRTTDIPAPDLHTAKMRAATARTLYPGLTPPVRLEPGGHRDCPECGGPARVHRGAVLDSAPEAYPDLPDGTRLPVRANSKPRPAYFWACRDCEWCQEVK